MAAKRVSKPSVFIDTSHSKELMILLKLSIKTVLYHFIFYSGLLLIWLTLLKRLRKKHYGIILFYHRFCRSRKDKGHVLPHLEAKVFERQLSHLKRWYNVVSLDTFVEHIRRRKPFNTPTIVITIDDGYRNNFTYAYPVLKKLSLPAIIYLTSGFVGTSKMPWVDELEYAIQNTCAHTFKFPQLFGDEDISISNKRTKRTSLHRLYREMLYLKHQDKTELIDELFQKLQVERHGYQNEERMMVNWEEVRQMRFDGISFGAHTLTHPTLPKLPLEEAKHEILESKRVIERNGDVCVKHFAVPNGTKKDFNDQLRDYCKNVAFESVVTTIFGVNGHKSDPFNLRRISPPDDLVMFAVEIARALSFYR
jgi:peptidoglycan/xylan/chitin deacetylase (PgdA/CDA1 family)